jgi:hypothetical protein
VSGPALPNASPGFLVKLCHTPPTTFLAPLIRAPQPGRPAAAHWGPKSKAQIEARISAERVQGPRARGLFARMRDVNKVVRNPGGGVAKFYCGRQRGATKRPSNGSKGTSPGLLGTPSRRRTSREKFSKLEPKFEKSGESKASVDPRLRKKWKKWEKKKSYARQILKNALERVHSEVWVT